MEENRFSPDKNFKRTVKTPAQVDALENFYNEHKYPTEEMKSELADQIGLTEKQISSWFCHRRLKDKRLRDEGCTNGRQDRSSGIIQDRGSGLRQDSCGSTKQGDYRNLDPREVESQRPYGQNFHTADLTYDRTSRYTGHDSSIDNISSGSSSSLQDKFVTQREDPYDAENSKYLAQNEAAMPLIPKGADSFGYKPSGYLKVKGEIENAAITAVKMQLGRHYKEDGPPLGVEFQPLPPGAFASPSRDPANGNFLLRGRYCDEKMGILLIPFFIFWPPLDTHFLQLVEEALSPHFTHIVGIYSRPIYVGDLAWMCSPDVSGVRKQSSLGTRYEVYGTKMSSHDSYTEGANCNPEPSDSHDKKSHHHLVQKPTYNGSNSNAGGNSAMDMPDDLAGETSAYVNKRHYRMSSKHGFEGRRLDSLSTHHGPSGRRNSEKTEAWLYDCDNDNPKIVQRNNYMSKHPHLMRGFGKSLDTEERAPCTMMEKEDKLYGEMKRMKAFHDPVRVRRHPTDESTVAKRFRVDFPQQEYVAKASFSERHRRTNLTKGLNPENMATGFAFTESVGALAVPIDIGRLCLPWRGHLVSARMKLQKPVLQQNEDLTIDGFRCDAPLLRGKKFSSLRQPIGFSLCRLIRQGPFSDGSPDSVDGSMLLHSMPVVLFVKANDSKTVIKLFSVRDGSTF
ncbi:hypothetical protein DKX38_014091 [Salix brachista]|uniref:Homeobox domain-containing protein n=1 Tax=Salix brachista TaxID=2182728 RepID=A0A5N5LEF9_9ROSI|nr:hypothetical protein DKX38_014091 [Salix brachista]